MDNKALRMMGLAKRAGKIVPGAPLTEKAIRGKKARLVIIAADAADNTKKSIINTSNYYKAQYRVCFTKEEISKAIGSSETAVLAVTDYNLAKVIAESIEVLE